MTEFVIMHPDGLTRCSWPKQDPLYLQYHDTEWGVKLVGENELFEQLALEGFQAGLSWITILKRREGFRKAFHNFNIHLVAKMTDKDIDRLMEDEGIIRNRAKIQSTIANAKTILELDGSLTDLIWSHAPKKSRRTQSPKDFHWIATSEESIALSKTLRGLGFGFVGPTTMYAMMQSIGMVNDHAPGCFRRRQLGN